jgi:hypothetical protein
MTLLIVLVILILLVAAGVVGFFYLQLKRGKQSRKPEVEGKLGTCSRCGQHRIIVKKEMELCASCWSSLNTKQIA